MRNLNLESIVVELSEKYGTGYDLATVIECLENALISAVLVVYKKTSFVMWDETVPHVYTASSNGIKEIEGFNNYTINLFAKFFNIFLKRRAQLEKLYLSSEKPGDITVGTVKEVMLNGNVSVDVDGIKGILKKEDQIVKERNKYFEEGKLFFYIKKTIDLPNGEIGLSLSRVSKNLVTGLLKLFSSKNIKSFYDLHGRMPVIFCWRRMAGFRADVYSELLFQKKALKKTRMLANDGYLAINPFKRR